MKGGFIIKFAKEFNPEQIKKMVKKVFPDASEFYNHNNYYRFSSQGEVYHYYFCCTENYMDEKIDIMKYNDNSQIELASKCEYICSIWFAFSNIK